MDLAQAVTVDALRRVLMRLERIDPMASDVDPERVCRAVHADRWRPGRLRTRRRRKADGTYRLIRIPPAADRALQGVVQEWVGPRVEGVYADAVHGFRAGRSVATAIGHLVGAPPAPWLELVQVDVRSLFDRLRLEDLRAGAEGVDDPLWRSLVARWLDAWVCEPGRGVPQGAPLSPVLANLALARVFDAQAVGPEVLRWVRYADDVTWLVGTRGGAAVTLVRAARALAAGGLELAPGKTRVTVAGPQTEMEVLGVELTFRAAEVGWRLCPRHAVLPPWARPIAGPDASIEGGSDDGS